ncbi:MAG: NAD(P)H-hydrate dehydratase [Methylotenera sp.]|nr:NAD(P)H-hydrate dehydratase [Oligoflexia bacterium]
MKLRQKAIRICTSSEMRELDRSAEVDYLIDATLLMENAGRSASQILLEHYPHAGLDTEILVFAGKGNNAGDAFVVARRLMCLDRRVRVFNLDSGARYTGASLKNFEILSRMKAKMTHLDSGADLENFFSSSPGPFTIVDGILGTGLKGNLEGVYYDVVEVINKLGCPEVVALDIPTGVSGDTGIVHGNSIQATLTVSFGFPKLGHFLPPGAARRGELVNVDISLPPKFRKEGDKFLLMRAPMSDLLKERDRYGHKNSFGHTLLIGGSPGRIGAIDMAARACHKMGTGLVTVASWEDSMDALLMKLPSETMASSMKTSPAELEAYRQTLSTYSSIVVGPGLGLRPEGKVLLQALLGAYMGPLVIDADALNLIADHKMHDMLINRRAPTVLTPHPGEMARLLGISKEEVSRDPVAALKLAVQKTHATVLLKGAATLIASTDDVLYLNHYPNDGMATAGSGDVLAGMIGGLLGQRMDAFQGTLLGVYLHSLSGDFAAQHYGHRSMTAPDIIENISNAFKEIKTHHEPALPLESRAKLL